MPVDRCDHAAAAALFNACHAGAVERDAAGLLQALADRVRGRALGERRVFKQLVVLHRAVVHARDLEHALRERAGLVEDDDLGLGQGLEIVRALDEDALVSCAAETREEAQRDADDQRAGAGDDKERERAVDPHAPRGGTAHQKVDERRQNGQRQRAVAHGGGVDAGKAGDERLGAGLVRAGVFHQLEDLRYCGLAEGLRRSDLQHARHVDAAADDLVAGHHVARQALARQRRGVERGRAVDDLAVDGDLLTRLHDDDRADGHVVGVDLLELAATLDVGVVGADVHQRRDVAAGLADGVALEQLADLIEQHDRHGLVIVAALFIDGERDRADGRDRHQEVFVEHLMVADALPCLAQDVVADGDVGGKIENGGDGHRQRHKLCDEEQRRRDQDAAEHLLLLFRHGNDLLFRGMIRK